MSHGVARTRPRGASLTAAIHTAAVHRLLHEFPAEGFSDLPSAEIQWLPID
jgi:hypothetical protein